ncbi:hypothetical protein SAMN05216383_12065 [Prevotella sp. KH2C16]|nr:hypothetical protein SAMN05216383_12065 [Prevotella sp. KH2C16]
MPCCITAPFTTLSLILIFRLFANFKANIMKKYLFLILLSLILFACGGNKKLSHAAVRYAESISGTSVLKATVTDVHVLIIAIDAIEGQNYDALARYYLNDAIKHGAYDIKMCAVVDYSTSEFQDGAVVGDRLGKAFK